MEREVIEGASNAPLFRLRQKWYKLGRRRRATFSMVFGALTIASGLGAFFLKSPNVGLLAIGLVLTGVLAISEGRLLASANVQEATSAEVARSNIARLLGRATRDVRLISGWLNPDVYAPLLGLIREKLQNGVQIGVVVGPDIRPETMAAFKALSVYKNFTLKVAMENPTPHGILVDAHMLRLERPHHPLSSHRENITFENAGISAAIFNATYERLAGTREDRTQPDQ